MHAYKYREALRQEAAKLGRDLTRRDVERVYLGLFCVVSKGPHSSIVDFPRSKFLFQMLKEEESESEALKHLRVACDEYASRHCPDLASAEISAQAELIHNAIR